MSDTDPYIPDPHIEALGLRQQLMDLHTGNSDRWFIVRAEIALEVHLYLHRDTLARTDFWRGTYEELETPR
ncbi:hypothetical protein [Nocardia fluminea]|uniref:hypothetical protein n=1 Tax=Actinomycetes TaxID=1760 RepID=UPI00364619A4